jgi:hypothetical protein
MVVLIEYGISSSRSVRSQTSWMWLESKLIELGMVGDESKKYKISFVLDRGPMFSVYSMRHNKPFKHEVKVRVHLGISRKKRFRD